MTKGKSAISARKSQKSAPNTPARTPRPAKGSKMATQPEDMEQAPPEGEQEQSNFEALMQAITNCQTTLTGKIEQVQLDISLIRRDMDTFRTRLTEAERRVGDAEDVLQDHTVSLRTLQTKIKSLETRAEDAENRNRRNNLRIVGLPEGTEGTDPTSFTEKLLRELLPQAAFSDVFVVGSTSFCSELGLLTFFSLFFFFFCCYIYLMCCATIYCIEEQGCSHVCPPGGMRSLISHYQGKRCILFLLSFFLFKLTVTPTEVGYQPAFIFFTANQ